MEAGAAPWTSDAATALPTLASWKSCATGSPLCHLLLTLVVIAPAPSRGSGKHTDRQPQSVSVQAGWSSGSVGRGERLDGASGVVGVAGTGTSNLQTRGRGTAGHTARRRHRAQRRGRAGHKARRRYSLNLRRSGSTGRAGSGGMRRNSGLGTAGAHQAWAGHCFQTNSRGGWQSIELGERAGGGAACLFALNFPQWGDRGPGGGTASLRSSLEVTSSAELIGSRYP